MNGRTKMVRTGVYTGDDVTLSGAVVVGRNNPVAEDRAKDDQGCRSGSASCSSLAEGPGSWRQRRLIAGNGSGRLDRGSARYDVHVYLPNIHIPTQVPVCLPARLS